MIVKIATAAVIVAASVLLVAVAAGNEAPNRSMVASIEIIPRQTTVATTTTTTTTTVPPQGYGSLSAAARAKPERVLVEDEIERAILIRENKPADPIDEFVRGFLDAGASEKYVNAFTRPRGIIFCESGFDPNANRGGLNIDHGLSQINQIHQREFVRIFDEPFRPGIFDPYKNGYMAGFLVERKERRGSPNPIGDWYASSHCHRYIL